METANQCERDGRIVGRTESIPNEPYSAVLADPIVCDREDAEGAGIPLRYTECVLWGRKGLPRLHLVAPPFDEQRPTGAFLDREMLEIDVLVAKVRDDIDRPNKLRVPFISVAVAGTIDVCEEIAA